ncbi:unnamed protein product [Sphagnum compactum]
MEVEIKLRLPDGATHEKVASLLGPRHEVTYLQENVFFDGVAQELSSKRTVLRLRFYNGDERCVATLKGKAVIIDGISRGTEVEEDIDVAIGRACVSDPLQLVDIDCKLIQAVVSDYGCRQFVCLGGFRNVRNVYSWESLKLELDETQYAFGTTYEIECETTEPERFREQLGSLLDSNSIPYSYSTMSKFGIFRSGKVPPFGGLTTA